MMVDLSIFVAFVSLGSTIFLGFFEEKQKREFEARLTERFKFYDEALTGIERLFDRTDAGIEQLRSQVSRPAIAQQSHAEEEWFARVQRPRG